MSRSKFPAKDRQPGNLYAIAVLASLHTGSGIAFIRPILCSIISVLRWVLVLCFATTVSSLIAALTPLTTQDVSLMLRSGYSNEAVLRELSTRRFGDTFDSKAEQQLIKAGAGESLINALRSGVYQLSPRKSGRHNQQRSARHFRNRNQTAKKRTMVAFLQRLIRLPTRKGAARFTIISKTISFIGTREI